MTALAFSALLIGTILWFLLPLLPALRELMRPTDAEPLTMVGQDAGELPVFAEGFRAYLRRELPDLMSSGAEHESQPAELPDGTPVAHLNGDLNALPELASGERVVSRLVLARSPVSLPGGETFLLEVYARDTLTGGPGTVYRAVLGERDIRLGPGTTILRWIHAEGDLSAGDDSNLAGRASAGGTMRLGRDVRFSRLRASRIVIGDGEPAVPALPPPLVSGTVKLPRTARQVRGFIRVDGDLTIPDDGSLAGTLVVSGSLRTGNRARIAGSVKVHGNCQIGERALVEGGLIVRGDVTVGDGAVILGPLVVEGSLSLGRDCSVGSPTSPASVAATHIVCATGVQVFGAMSVRGRGIVASR